MTELWSTSREAPGTEHLPRCSATDTASVSRAESVRVFKAESKVYLIGCSHKGLTRGMHSLFMDQFVLVVMIDVIIRVFKETGVSGNISMGYIG